MLVGYQGLLSVRGKPRCKGRGGAACREGTVSGSIGLPHRLLLTGGLISTARRGALP